MIGHYKLSLIGRSHLSEEGGVCQDSCDVKHLQNGWVAAAVADGLGSAKHSDAGSALAVSEVLRFIELNIPESWHEESLLSLLRIAFHSALKQIKTLAAAEGNHIRDYDTTLTSAIYNGTNAVFGHVGDGGIITLSPYGDFSLLTVAQKGEEFNSTYPLRSGPGNWLFGSAPESAAALLMLTDGVYDIACPWQIARQEQKIYVNYVRPFIDRNLSSLNTAADFETLQKECEEFLSGEQSRQITDDKTIIGIINTEIMPEIKPDEYYAEPDWKRLTEVHNEKLYGPPPSPELPKGIAKPELKGSVKKSKWSWLAILIVALAVAVGGYFFITSDIVFSRPEPEKEERGLVLSSDKKLEVPGDESSDIKIQQTENAGSDTSAKLNG